MKYPFFKRNIGHKTHVPFYVLWENCASIASPFSAIVHVYVLYMVRVLSENGRERGILQVDLCVRGRKTDCI